MADCRLCGIKLANVKIVREGYAPISSVDSTICTECEATNRAQSKKFEIVDEPEVIASPNKDFKATYNEIKKKLEEPKIEDKALTNNMNNKPVIATNLSYNWVEYAKDNEIELYERQPEETDLEWLIWQQYRDQYPMSTPKITVAADATGTDITIAKAIYKKWTYPLRIQHWIEFVDKELVERRRQQAITMHNKHIDMASSLTEKLADYIDGMTSEDINPNALPGLIRAATELEQKARIDKIDAEDTGKPGVEGDNPMLKKVDIKQKDVTDVLEVLKGAGILNTGAKVGIETKDGDRILVEQIDDKDDEEDV